MPELDSQPTTTRILPETALAEAIAEYCRVTRATLDEVRFLRRAYTPAPALDLCTYETRIHRGGTGVWDEAYPCREPGTVCNLADAHDADTPGALYCLRHEQQREKEQEAEQAADEQRECPGCRDGSHYYYATPAPELPATCPKCGSADWMPADEGAFAACNDCGFTDYDDYTRQIMAEVQREQKQAKQILGYVPTYTDAVKQGFA